MAQEETERTHGNPYRTLIEPPYVAGSWIEGLKTRNRVVPRSQCCWAADAVITPYHFQRLTYDMSGSPMPACLLGCAAHSAVLEIAECQTSELPFELTFGSCNCDFLQQHQISSWVSPRACLLLN